MLGIVYRCIATHLIKKARFSRMTAQTGAVTLIQRFGSALKLSVHFAVHGCTNAAGAWMRRSGPFVVPRRGVRRTSRWLTLLPLGDCADKRRACPTDPEPGAAYRPIPRAPGPIGTGCGERLSGRRWPRGRALDQLLGSSITYRIAVGPQQGRKVFTLPACEESFDAGVGKVAGFSLHAGVAAHADQRKKLERLCRSISRPAVAKSTYR